MFHEYFSHPYTINVIYPNTSTVNNDWELTNIHKGKSSNSPEKIADYTKNKSKLIANCGQ